MSAEERRQEQKHLAQQVDVAKATAQRAKEELAACKAAKKAARSTEQKRAAAEACATAEQAVKDAAARVSGAVAQEKAFREAVAAEQKAAADPLEKLAAKYAKAYPACKVFHITADGQVFLDKDEHLARYHQRGLGEGEVRTIKMH